jgi:small-conductance mechanosensitive channel
MQQLIALNSYSLSEILAYKLINIGSFQLTTLALLSAFLVFVIGFFSHKLIHIFIHKSPKIDVGKKHAFSQIIKYLLIVITFIMAFRTIGVDMSPLIVGSGAILVGISMGLQNLFLDFISGVIILVDRTIRVDDIIDVNGVIGKVKQINFRTTSILTTDNKNIVFPNSVLTKDKVTNLTYDDNIVQFEISIDVHYESNEDLVKQLLVAAAKAHPSISTHREPFARLFAFGDICMTFKLYFFYENLFAVENVKSDIRINIIRKFRENNVDIPYRYKAFGIPQNLLHHFEDQPNK